MAFVQDDGAVEALTSTPLYDLIDTFTNVAVAREQSVRTEETALYEPVFVPLARIVKLDCERVILEIPARNIFRADVVEIAPGVGDEVRARR